MTRRLLCLLTTCAILISGTGCFTPAFPPAEPPAPGAPPGPSFEIAPDTPRLSPPMTEYGFPDFSDTAGFLIYAGPWDYDLESCALIGGKIGQLVFSGGNNLRLTLRVAIEPAGDISGVSETFAQTGAGLIGAVTVYVGENPGRNALAIWTQGHAVLSLYMENTARTDIYEVIQAFVEDIGLSFSA